MSKKAIGIMTGSLAGIAALGGSFLIGRETAPEGEPKVTDTFSEALQNTNDACASAVLEAAELQFTFIGNNVETAADEEHDSKLVAQTDGDVFVKEEMGLCMSEELPEGLTGYETQIPVFEPIKKEGN